MVLDRLSVRKRKTIKIIVLASFVIIGIIYGCDQLLTYDDRDKIAMSMLFHDEKTDAIAFDGAFSARFLNQSPDSLFEYIKSIKGQCGISKSNNVIECSFPVRGVFCIGERLWIEGTIEENKITKIRTSSYYPGC